MRLWIINLFFVSFGMTSGFLMKLCILVVSGNTGIFLSMMFETAACKLLYSSSIILGYSNARIFFK
jgi:hypothetical protein